MVLVRRRIEIRRIDALIRQGLLREAATALQDPDVRQCRDGCFLVRRLVAALCNRAAAHISQGHFEDGADDLELAARLAPGDPQVADLRSKLMDAICERAKNFIDRGQPEMARELIERLRLWHLHGGQAVTLERAAKLWCHARRALREGRVREALTGLQRARSELPETPALEAELRELQRLESDIRVLESRLTEAYANRDWQEVRRAADDLLLRLPGHEIARRARQRACAAVAGSLYATAGKAALAGGMAELTRIDASVERSPQAPVWHVLVDGGGNYLLTTADSVTIGNWRGDADIKLLCDVRSQHVRIDRDREGYVLVPLHPVLVNGRQAVRPVPLREGTRVELSKGAAFTFRLPSPLSRTALLVPELRSVFRQRVDAVVLMARVCVFGSDAQSHVRVPSPVRLTLVVGDPGAGRFCVRSDGEICINGQCFSGEGEFSPPGRIELPDGRIVFARA